MPVSSAGRPNKQPHLQNRPSLFLEIKSSSLLLVLSEAGGASKAALRVTLVFFSSLFHSCKLTGSSRQHMGWNSLPISHSCFVSQKHLPLLGQWKGIRDAGQGLRPKSENGRTFSCHKDDSYRCAKTFLESEARLGR